MFRTIEYTPFSVKEFIATGVFSQDEIRHAVLLRCGGTAVELSSYADVPSATLLFLFDALHHVSPECVLRLEDGGAHIALFSHVDEAVRPSDVDMRFVQEEKERKGEGKGGEFHIDLTKFLRSKKSLTLETLESAWKAFSESCGAGAEIVVLHGNVPPPFLFLAAHWCYGKTRSLSFDNGRERVRIFHHKTL